MSKEEGKETPVQNKDKVEDNVDAKPQLDEKKQEDSKDSKDNKDAKSQDLKGDDSKPSSQDNKNEKKEDYVNFGGAGDDEDPYADDEKKYNEDFRKTFITQDKNKKEQDSLFTLHDMMIPAGKTSKLIRVPNPNHEDFRVTEPFDKLKFVEPTPVIILAGAMTERAGKVLAGVARAAFRAGACVIDSGIGSGIEKFCMRKNVPLVGICPENEISYPVNSSNKKENELTNGHTHFVLIGDDNENKYRWGDEAKLKAEVAKRIAKGRNKYGNSFQWKIIMVVIGDNPNCVEDLAQAKENNFPIIVLEGSQFWADIIASKGGLMEDEDDLPLEDKKTEGEGDAEDNIGAQKKEPSKAPQGKEIRNGDLSGILGSEKIYLCKQNSEHIANISHLLLTVTL